MGLGEEVASSPEASVAEPRLAVRELTKRFGGLLAVDRCSFEVEQADFRNVRLDHFQINHCGLAITVDKDNGFRFDNHLHGYAPINAITSGESAVKNLLTVGY